ncbi:Retinoblastoma-like protein 1 [Phytophthora boehmeriae]|uniref:Retinoblastoma-like protein 1 n=1 Tax=Phytophthora boehmeriae TaxID=109152 RepID=A0A8T1X0A5_9STRA|nr:Retinoblastoma-like protein 1 [Phytophthora boehmeriae]
MPRQEGSSAEISFETLTIDDIEVREKDVVEGSVRYVVSYAAAIQGMETSRINYKDLRRACTSLGVRYYKNRNKDTMLELIAQKKLKGEVPESYRHAVKHQRDDEEEEGDVEETKRQRVVTEDENGVNGTTSVLPCTTDDSTHPPSPPRPSNPVDVANLVNPVAPDAPKSPTNESRSDSSSASGNDDEENDSVVSATGRTIKDRVEALNTLCHIRQQIREVEQHLAAHLLSDGAGINYEDKAKRLKEDLQFYLAERRSLMQHLDNTRSQ